MSKSRIEALCAAVSVTWAWQYFELPGEPGRNCRSPFRKDKNPSFSVWLDQSGIEKWKDHGSGEMGSVIDFWMKVKGVSLLETLKQMEAVVGLGLAQAPKQGGTYKPAQEEEPASKKERLVWPSHLRPPTDQECLSLSILREIPSTAFNTAWRLGTLMIGHHPKAAGEPLWWITDARRLGAEGRTFDGAETEASHKKCAALSGTEKHWPYGLQTLNRDYDTLEKIVMVEGGPDYYAALHLADLSEINFRVVAMLGSAVRVGKEALTLLRGKHVLIIPHNDEGGQRAAQNWKEQLLTTASKVTIQRLRPEVADLNDLLKINPDASHLMKGFNG